MTGVQTCALPIFTIQPRYTLMTFSKLLGAKKVGVKWIYKTRFNENGEVDKYKAKLVAKGYTQQHGVDHTEVFAHVARMEKIQLLAALAAQRG